MSTNLSKDQVAAGLADIVHEITGVAVDPTTHPNGIESLSFADDLDIDSLSMVEVVVTAEEKFQVPIPDDVIRELKTVGDAAAYIARSLASGTAPN
ncbi:acyl carrier protein [Streptomyces sp. NPDC090442]|uniref:acyl carrier protein n=1 Tax=Streptomyces sp. NPDC090442 TaxID=3365962 RepID=UPI00382926C8